MINIIVIVGESASGKSSIEKELVDKYGFKKLISYTTRKPRKNEVDGVDYHFVTQEHFNTLKDEGFFAEIGCYNNWSYGCAIEDCTDDKVAVLTPHGLRQMKAIEGLDIVSYYIKVPRRDRLIKILQRGDNIEESYRRNVSDLGMFDGIENEVDYVIENDGYVKSIEGIAYSIASITMSLKHCTKKDGCPQERLIKPIALDSINFTKPPLFLDYDGCITNTIKAIVDLYNQDFKYYKNYKPIEWSDIETWGFTECNCATSDYINTYFNQQRFYDNLEYMENANEILDELKNHFNIKIVSMGYSPNLKGKEIWIKKNMPYAEFIGVNFKEYEDKSHIDMSGGILIDDSANNLITSSSDVKICYGDTHEWNKNWTGKRCWNWYEVREYLMS